MGLSRDVDQIRLSCTVWSLEGVKVDFRFSLFFINISETSQVKGLKL